MATQPMNPAQVTKAHLAKQQANSTTSRHFTGDANRVFPQGMDANTSSSIDPDGAAGIAYSKPTLPSSQFTAGTASMPVSPSKKRLHKHIKLPSAAAPTGSAASQKVNPFAQHGLTDAATKPTASSRVSPGKSQQTSPAQGHRRAVRQSSTVQGMNIDTPVQAANPDLLANGLNPAQPNPTFTQAFAGFSALAAVPVSQQPGNQSSDTSSFSFKLGQSAAADDKHAGEGVPQSSPVIQLSSRLSYAV